MKAWKPSHAQLTALKVLKEEGPQAPGFFDSGWGPLLYGERSHRVKIGQPTADGLVRLGYAAVKITGNKVKDKVLHLTPAGEEAYEAALRASA